MAPKTDLNTRDLALIIAHSQLEAWRTIEGTRGDSGGEDCSYAEMEEKVVQWIDYFDDRVKDFLYRFYFPMDRVSYHQAMALAEQGDDRRLYRLISLFPEVAECHWMAARRLRAEKEGNYLFIREVSRHAGAIKAALAAVDQNLLWFLIIHENNLICIDIPGIITYLKDYLAGRRLPPDGLPTDVETITRYCRSLGWETGKSH
ncbi:MAG: hypothetical protein HQK59_04870 [Deltaproteobacteria bacterium]|nr:hypothetical protein [Deltaproteobacteria bacterium]